MWEAVTKEWQPDGPTIWRSDIYEIALAVARGETDIAIDAPGWADSPAYQGGYLADLRTLFPFLNLQYDDVSAQENANRVSDRIEKEARTLLDRVCILNQTNTDTLHQALDAYHKYVTLKYAGKSNQRPQQRLVTLLKKHGVSVALDKFDADAIDQCLAIWCKRPTGQTGPLALATCRNTLIALRQFIRWLSRSTAFQWEMPRGFTFPRCRIDRTNLA